uniref:tyrosine-type recombinase/integrase n=1 Tax=Rheinheimera sp. TaxID=1869214 RepID=UPI0040477916
MKTYDLLDPLTGESVAFYAEYLNKIIQEQISNSKQAQNSIDAQASDLHVFLEYVVNAQEIFYSRKITTNSTLLAEIILSYRDYLTLGVNSQKAIARETAAETQRKPISISSANRYLSSVNGFVSASATEHERLNKAKELGFIDIDVSSEDIHRNLLQRRKLSENERKRLLRESVLAQVVSGGGKYTRTRLFGISRKASSKNDYQHFPVSHIEDLLDKAPSYMDRALWALLLGAGLRTSEACQLLISDVDIVTEELHVFTYRDRVKCFEGLAFSDTLKLSFKGRETENAAFIEPFGEIFFEAITNYLKFERPKNLSHNYLFVTNSNNGRGRPLFAASRTTRNGKFKKIQELISCPTKHNGRRFTLHSLRHFYGYWLLNFHLTEKGERFSLLEVQRMMGHANVNSTKIFTVTLSKEVIFEYDNASMTFIAA